MGSLKECVDGPRVPSKIPHKRLPDEEYPSQKGRFAHLFQAPRNAELLDLVQSRVDAYWDDVT